jgi:tRNA (cmo5U34)-methyltransferase
MSADHRVLGHLRVDAAEYDREIRRFIPGYDDMLRTAVRWLEGHVPAGGLVIDLGAGTGALSAAVLEALPEVRVRLVDVDPAMLEVAKARCRDRVEQCRATFAEGLVACDAVVASLSLHHVADVAEKRALYRRIHDVLRPGGLLVICDACVHASGPERTRLFEEWSQGMQRAGITAAEAQGHFAQWATEDFYQPLADELVWLREAGFAQADCFWKLGAQCVYGGFRG